MKNKYIRLTGTIALIAVLVLTLVGFCSCDRNGGDGDETELSYEVPIYETIPSYYLDVFDAYYDLDGWTSSGKIIDILQSTDDLGKYNIQDSRFTQEYFQERVVLMIEFRSTSSDEDIKFRDIAIKDNKFYPIFISTSPIGGEPWCDDMFCNVYEVECAKDVLNYEYGGTLAINRRDTNCGGGRYQDSIRTVFK